mgnify:CR=1 FL=1
MSDSNPFSSKKSPKEALLDELQSIKGLLDDDVPSNLNIEEIPILEDVVLENVVLEGSALEDSTPENVPEESANQPLSKTAAPNAKDEGLLDLDSIFEGDLTDTEHLEDDLSQRQINADNVDANTLINDDLAAEDLEEDNDIASLDLSALGLETDLTTETLSSHEQNPDEKLIADEPELELPILSATQTTQPSPENERYQEEQDELFPELTSALTLTPNTEITTDQQPLELGTIPLQQTDTNAAELHPITNEMDVELLIQEIVDELIPTIEDQLRQRLSKCSTRIIQQLAAKHLDK